MMRQPESAAPAGKRSIFREHAYKRYIQGREKKVLPKSLSPPTFIYFWALAGLLLSVAAIAWSARVPVYASGYAVVVNNNSDAHHNADDVRVVAFLPPEDLSLLQAGQILTLQFDKSGERLERPIEVIELSAGSSGAAIKRFGISESDAQRISGPAVIAIAQVHPASSGLPASAQPGSVYRAKVQVGSRRVISFLPVIGKLFESS